MDDGKMFGLVMIWADQFSCKVESDGSVRILGLTETGQAAIIRQERVFVMRYQLQCPPGPFEINFHLPGPVKPSLIASKFGTDGIFEAMVIKDKGIWQEQGPNDDDNASN